MKTLFYNKFEFERFCKELAEKLDTIVVIKTYEDFRFDTAAFMTDKFGGTYANIKFDWDSLETANTFDSAYNPYESKIDLVIKITEEKMKMEAARDLNAISEQVNAEY